VSPGFLSDVKARHNKTAELVERLLDLRRQVPKAKTLHEQESRERQIAAIYRAIDLLSDAEVRIAGGAE